MQGRCVSVISCLEIIRSDLNDGYQSLNLRCISVQDQITVYEVESVDILIPAFYSLLNTISLLLNRGNQGRVLFCVFTAQL
jgi:hypothetical protein